MKRVFKIFLWILAGLFIFYLGLEAGFDLRLTWEPHREARAWLKLKEVVEEIYRQDKYGGKTPEETFNLFLTALEKGDLDLASKYFVVDKQDEWRQNLEKIKANGHLAEMVEDLGGADLTEKDDFEATYYVKSVSDQGEELWTPIILHRVKLSGIWKISVL